MNHWIQACEIFCGNTKLPTDYIRNAFFFINYKRGERATL